jgi:hypothetical protein
MTRHNVSVVSGMALAILIARPSMAADLTVRLDVPKTDFVQGEPLLVAAHVANAGGETLAFARAAGSGYATYFTLEPLAGPAGTLCPQPARRDAGRVSWLQAPPGWRDRYERRFDCAIAPGDYVIRFTVASDEPWKELEVVAPPPGRPWSGRIEAAPVAIRVDPPIGVDRDAFDALAGRPLDDPECLLSDFPTSTYAGYALLHGGPWPLDRDIEISTAARLEAIAERDPDARPQIERLLAERRAMIRDRVHRLEAYLRARPDFVFADFMRRELEIRREEEN